MTDFLKAFFESTRENVMPDDAVYCAGCRCPVKKTLATSVTKTIHPFVVDYYHDACWDPWSDAAMEKREREKKGDAVNHPDHYTWLSNGVEVIDITESLNFCLGNAVKYILRADHKGNPIQDLKKSVWYITRELERRQRDNAND